MAATQTKARQSRAATNGRTGSAPAPLATPSDLAPEDVRAVVEAVNPLIADSFALYVKTKNFHWHLAGSHFRDYHLLFDEQAATILASIDPLAERLRKIGGTTLRSIGHIGQLQTLDDDDADFVPPPAMIERLLADNRQMATAQRAAIKVCEEHEDTPTANILEEILDETERRIWFLFEISQGADNAQ